MGREVRRVHKNWEHPKTEDGGYAPLFEGYDECVLRWDKDKAEWDTGRFPGYASEGDKEAGFEEWAGERPGKNEYMPQWPEGAATHYMMYETTTEGTPLSPAFETPEELAKWLSNTCASAFGSQTASYAGWLRVAQGGFACSAILSSRDGLKSGVDAG